MAESFIQLPADGSGKKSHSFDRTIGGNVVHDSVAVAGEQYLASYVVGHEALASTATLDSHLLQLMAGAALNLRVRRIEIYMGALATAATLMNVAVVRLTTAGTGGTAQTARALDPSDAAAGASAMSLPTAKGTEGVRLAWSNPYMLQTVAASSQLVQPIACWDFDRIHGKPLIVPAGTSNGIAVKNLSAVAGASVLVAVYFDEANF